MNSLQRSIDILLREYLLVDHGTRLLFLISPEISVQTEADIINRIMKRAIEFGVFVEVAQGSSDFKALEHLIIGFDRIVCLNRNRAQFSDELDHFLISNPAAHRRAYQIFDFSAELLDGPLTIHKDELKTLNSALLLQLAAAKSLRASSEEGTELQIQLSSATAWTNAYGESDSSYVAVLPAGEVNTYTSEVSGKLCAGGAINTNFGWSGTPILPTGNTEIEIANGRVIAARSSSYLVQQQLESFFSVPNADRVGEVGIGTNAGARRLVNFVSHINERTCGLHIGFGTPVALDGNANYDCPLHLDVMCPGAHLFVDNRRIYDGKAFLLDVDLPDGLTRIPRVRSLVDTR